MVIEDLIEKIGEEVKFEMNFSSTIIVGILKEIDNNIMTVITSSGLRYIGIHGVKRFL